MAFMMTSQLPNVAQVDIQKYSCPVVGRSLKH